MTVAPDKTHAFCFDNTNELSELARHADIVICPSFVALGTLCHFIDKQASDAHVSFGAQNCSEYASGAYTGEVDALSLKQIGCTFCIVGHSERRKLFHETDTMIAQKIKQLRAHNITSILCIGETLEENQQGATFSVLEKQLSFVSQLYKDTSDDLIIAYEPVWAIGTGIVPTLEQLSSIMEWIKNYTLQTIPQAKIRYVYGGSVNATSIQELKTLTLLDGFLIGAASSDFQTFKNIVL